MVDRKNTGMSEVNESKKQAKKLEDTTRRAAEAMEAARMKRCGLTLKEIGANLGCSLQKAHVSVHEGIHAYREQARQEIKAWTEGCDRRTAGTEARGLDSVAAIESRTGRSTSSRITEDGSEDTDTTEGQCADARYSAEIRGCIESIGKLLGVIRHEHQRRPRRASDEPARRKTRLRHTSNKWHPCWAR